MLNNSLSNFTMESSSSKKMKGVNNDGGFPRESSLTRILINYGTENDHHFSYQIIYREINFMYPTNKLGMLVIYNMETCIAIHKNII